ncbi:MAG: protein-L-isoaspartate O-methyltransferase [Sphingomonadales bacterium]|nr:protein-L-isoaspartate O-methyltransferase [Sphingomonadales bacterium]
MTLTEERPVNLAAARRAMIDSQLRTSGVNEPWVLTAMNSLPREDFVPAALRDTCYIDRALPLGEGRFLAAPLVHGKMLAEAAPAKDDRALVVTSGSDYLAALLAPLVGSMDRIDAAEAALKGVARGKRGTYSLLVIDGAIEQLPANLAAALAEGGRVVTGLAERGVTRLAVGRMIADQVVLQPLADIGMPVLAEFAAAKGWSF